MLCLLGNNGLFSGQLHFNLFSLNVIKPQNLITFIHFALPSHELSFISLMQLKILESFLLLFLSFLESQCFSLNSCSIQLNIGVYLLFMIWHLTRLCTRKLKFLLEIWLKLFLHFVKFINIWTCFRGQLKSFFRVLLVLSADWLCFSFSSIFLFLLNVGHSFFENVFGEWISLYLLFDFLRSWDFFRLRFC